jgi:neurofibromin 1
MSLYAKTYGSKYLISTLQPIIQDVANSPAIYGVEIDPAKLQQPEDLDKNIAIVKNLTVRFIDVINSSASAIPRYIYDLVDLFSKSGLLIEKMTLILLLQKYSSFRDINGWLATAVTKRFPDVNPFTIVSGFMFLRFFCPAIISPTEFGIVQQVNPAVRKTLIYVTKIIQNLGNNVLFGHKESFMVGMNDIPVAKTQQVELYLKDVSVKIIYLSLIILYVHTPL